MTPEAIAILTADRKLIARGGGLRIWLLGFAAAAVTGWACVGGLGVWTAYKIKTSAAQPYFVYVPSSMTLGMPVRDGELHPVVWRAFAETWVAKLRRRTTDPQADSDVMFQVARETDTRLYGQLQASVAAADELAGNGAIRVLSVEATFQDPEHPIKDDTALLNVAWTEQPTRPGATVAKYFGALKVAFQPPEIPKENSCKSSFCLYAVAFTWTLGS